MIHDRKKKLEKNFTTMFWVQALMNFKIINVIITLFYIHRGLSLGEIFFLSIIWSLVTLVSEIPSSYLADRWGRKKTLLLGICFALINWVVLLVADNLVIFACAVVFLALQYALFSGTDEALIYDTNKELGNHNDSLKRLSSYYSARSIFKILTPLISVFIAQDLVEGQFVTIICMDIVAVIISLILALRIIEPYHYMDVEKQEAGVFKDAVQLIKNNAYMIRGILSKTFVFIASFIIWRYHQDLLVNHLGLSVIVLGVAWTLYHGGVFLWEQYMTPRFYDSIARSIDITNSIFFIISAITVGVVILTKNPFVVLISIMLLLFSERIRWSLYSQFFNNYSNSFNRATTISLSHFLKSILDLPLLFLAAILVEQNMTYPFFLTIILAFIVIIFFRLSPKRYEHKTS